MARILLADDDQATRDLVSRALTSEGHKVDVTADGQEALELLQRRSSDFDLLISDIEMPGLDGIALIKAARALVPSLRVLLMSGFESSAHRAGEIGDVRCITKPFTLEKIRAEAAAALT